LKPASPLLPDRWYRLRIAEDADLRVLDDRRTTDPPAEPWATHFFTGSAPSIIGLRALRTDAEPSLTVVFSEPVHLEQIRTLELVSRAGKAVTRPIAGLTVASDHVVLPLTLSAEELSSAPLDLRLPGSLRGRSRTVAEGTAVAHLPARASLHDGAVHRTIEPEEWYLCEDGAALCWSETR
jgi:hypothetical protein